MRPPPSQPDKGTEGSLWFRDSRLALEFAVRWGVGQRGRTGHTDEPTSDDPRPASERADAYEALVARGWAAKAEAELAFKEAAELYAACDVKRIIDTRSSANRKHPAPAVAPGPPPKRRNLRVGARGGGDIDDDDGGGCSENDGTDDHNGEHKASRGPRDCPASRKAGRKHPTGAPARASTVEEKPAAKFHGVYKFRDKYMLKFPGGEYANLFQTAEEAARLYNEHILANRAKYPTHPLNEALLG
jgi:hypothetical protein